MKMLKIQVLCLALAVVGCAHPALDQARPRASPTSTHQPPSQIAFKEVQAMDRKIFGPAPPGTEIVRTPVPGKSWADCHQVAPVKRSPIGFFARTKCDGIVPPEKVTWFSKKVE